MKTLTVFPSAMAAENFRREMLGDENVALDTFALTFKRLVDEIVESTENDRRVLGNAGRRLLLRKITNDYFAEKGGAIHKLSTFPGFVTALDSFISDLKLALVTPEKFVEVLGGVKHDERLDELAVLYSLYSKAMDDLRVLDKSDIPALALSSLRGGCIPGVLSSADEVVFDGIYHFAPVEKEIVLEISRLMSVTVTFPMDFERPELFGYISKTWDDFEAVDNSDLNLDLVASEPAETFLRPVLVDIFRARTSKVEPRDVDGVTVIAAPGRYQECEEIGRKVRGLLDDGVGPDQIAVLFRDMQNYGPIMEEVCQRYSIPVSYRRGTPLFNAAIVQTILAPFGVIKHGYGREELVSLIKSSYFPGLLDVDGAVLPGDVCETLLLDSSYIDETSTPVAACIGRHIAMLKRQERPYHIEEKILGAVTMLLDDIKAFDQHMTMSAFLSTLESFIAKYGIYQRILVSEDRHILRRDMSAVKQFRQVLEDIRGDLEALGVYNKVVSPEEFVGVVRQSMKEEFLSSERTAGVGIMTFFDIQKVVIDHVFVGGLNEGVCPARHNPDPFFKDKERLEFNRALASRPLFRTSREFTLEEPLLFFQAISGAAESLTLTYSYVDAKGNGLLCSPYLEDFRSIARVPEERMSLSETVPDLDRCFDRTELTNRLALGGYLKDEECKNEVLRNELLCDFVRRVNRSSYIESLRDGFFALEAGDERSAMAGPYTGRLCGGAALPKFLESFQKDDKNSFSPTELEDYGGCPFAYFLKHILKVADLEKPEVEIAVREEGSLVHEILHDFYLRLKVEDRFPVCGDAYERSVMQEIALSVFDRWERTRYVGNAFMWGMMKKRLADILNGVIDYEAEHGSDKLPFAFEWQFEKIEVADGGGGKFFLKGKIDRVDLNRADRAVRVTDYKLASNKQRYGAKLKKEVFGVTSFQMPIYVIAAEYLLFNQFDVICEDRTAMYWLLKGRSPVGKHFEKAKDEDYADFFETSVPRRMELGEENFLNRVAGVVNRIKGGDFQVTPSEGCDYCSYGYICRRRD